MYCKLFVSSICIGTVLFLSLSLYIHAGLAEIVRETDWCWKGKDAHTHTAWFRMDMVSVVLYLPNANFRCSMTRFTGSFALGSWQILTYQATPFGALLKDSPMAHNFWDSVGQHHCKRSIAVPTPASGGSWKMAVPRCQRSPLWQSIPRVKVKAGSGLHMWVKLAKRPQKRPVFWVETIEFGAFAGFDWQKRVQLADVLLVGGHGFPTNISDQVDFSCITFKYLLHVVWVVTSFYPATTTVQIGIVWMRH